MQTHTTILWVFGGSSMSLRDHTRLLVSKSQELSFIKHNLPNFDMVGKKTKQELILKYQEAVM